jgi:dipeptidase E
MKLYLASFAGKVIDKFDFSKRKKVAFITTAANNYKDKWFVELDRNALQSKSLETIDIDIADMNKSQLAKTLRGFDTIFVAGGNAFFLLEKMRSSGFKEVLKSCLKKDVLYIGSSAGSVVMCPDIEYVSSMDDPKEANLKEYNGLRLVEFYILPHCGREKYAARIEKILHENKDKKFELLTDEEYIEVTDKGYKRK